MLLWLWCRLAAASLIRPLAWEPPYAVSVTLKKKKKTVLTQPGHIVFKAQWAWEAQARFVME